MKLRSILVLALTLACSPALAQVTLGTSPLTIAKGGTGGATASAARTSLGLGSMATQNANAVAVTGGSITGLPTPSNPSDAATKSYADGLAAGLTILGPSRLATAAVLPNTPTYNNGASGVGATLTAGSNSTLTVDGTVANLNDVVLVNNQAAPAQNGIYTVTTAGSGSAAWVLTRATYFNSSANMLKGDYTFISAGSSNINTSWVLSANVATVGTTAVAFNQFSGSGVASFNGRTGAVVPANSDYNAGQITYTPPGTGGMATNLQTEIQRYGLWANDFGAACNGTGNDATAFQNAINEAQTLGLAMRFAGACQVGSGLSVTSNLEIAGVGSGSSSIISSNLAVNIITVTTVTNTPVYFHDFGLTYSAASNSGTAAIVVTAPTSNQNDGSVFERLVVTANANAGINFIKADFWKILECTIQAALNGIIVQNTNNVDAGDSSIVSSVIGASTSGVAVNWQSSGGLRFTSSKIIGTNMSFGMQFALASGAQTVDIFITGSSIEGMSSTGAAIAFERAGTTGTLAAVMITGSELSGKYCVFSPTDVNGQWLFEMTITGTTCSLLNATGAAYSLDSIIGLSMSGNSVNSGGAGSIKVATGNALTNSIIDEPAGNGAFGASVYGTGTIIRNPFPTAFGSLSTPADGSDVLVTGVTLASSPCSGGASTSHAFRMNGAWKCL